MAGSLEDRVAVITGSSRGIGRALALKLASAGADIVVTGKSVAPTTSAPGTIHDVADEVRTLGRRALPVQVNVREEADIQHMIDAAMTEFGRIDILINNAGALWWEKVVDSPPNRIALMYEVNLRATYLATYYVLPHMVAAGWGHIITNSPPIMVDPTPGHAMYNTTKMGMTRFAVSVAAEHRADNVAANSLWPATPIDSAATRAWGSEKMGRPDQWRTPDIYCDAALEVLSTPPQECTGRQLIDEDFLRERGWTDEQIDSYWLSGAAPAEPMWIDRRWYSDSMKHVDAEVLASIDERRADAP